METLISIIVAFLVAAVVIYIVGRLNLGLTVDSYGSAIIAAIVIAIVGGIVLWLLGLLGVSVGGGLLGAIVYLVIAAISKDPGPRNSGCAQGGRSWTSGCL